MVTRLKNISTSIITKTIAFILVVIAITTVIVEIQYIVYKNINTEVLFIEQYKDSDEFITKYFANAERTCLAITNNKKVQQDIKFYYYITDGDKTYSNTENTDKSFFERYDSAFYAFEKGVKTVGKNTNPKAASNYGYDLDSKYTAYIAFSNEFISEKQSQWQESRAMLMPIAVSIAGLTGLALFLIIYLICVTGIRPQDKEIHLSKMDKIYSDILIFSFIPIGVAWLKCVIDSPFGGGYRTEILNINQIYSMIWTGIVTSFVSVICGFLLLSIVRKIKAGKLLKHSLIFIVFYKIYDFFKSMFDGRRFKNYPLTKSLFYRQVIFIGTSAFLVFCTILFGFIPPLFFIPPILEIVVIYWYIKGNNKTYMEINKGFNESLEEQMRAERMKIALVTNVSHDLKTPLTSIISYVDLLTKEENLSETASDYVKILAEKSNRLKNIVADLFDLAKSASGDIKLDLESLDLKKLIEQTIADMEDEICKSGLQVKVKLTEKPVNIISDGKKLYRVFQNVMDNALKYSLNGTRIYVDLENVNGKAIASIKNIAGYEMDFTAEEVLQRFTRGDKSRTTEGSGLGLSIAQSFTNVCGGEFKVDIEGDLFKVTISFNQVR